MQGHLPVHAQGGRLLPSPGIEATVRAAEQILENKDLLLSLTDYEAYNMTRFADGTNHAGDFADLPEDERAKLPKHWTDGSVYGR